MDGEDEHEEETEYVQLSNDDEPGYVMGTITKSVQQCMERFWQKQMKLDELTQQEVENASDYIRCRDQNYGTCDIWVAAAVQHYTDDDAVAPAPTSFREQMECLDIVPGISQMPQETS